MKTYTIEFETNNITIHPTVQEADAVANAQHFSNEAALAKLAADWPTNRLVEIWNSLPGATPVKKFTDRKTAISRIWKAIQSLDTATGKSIASEPEHAAAEPEAIALAESDPVVTADPELLAEVVVEGAERTEAPAADAPEPAGVPTRIHAQVPDVAPEAAAANPGATPVKKARKTADKPTREGSKTAQLIAMLKREGGTTIEEIVTAMGWQKHTTRAMLSAGGSLTKNHGLVITSEKVGDQRRYSIKQ